jgi:hypothetical protein
MILGLSSARAEVSDEDSWSRMGELQTTSANLRTTACPAIGRWLLSSGMGNVLLSFPHGRVRTRMASFNAGRIRDTRSEVI